MKCSNNHFGKCLIELLLQCVLAIYRRNVKVQCHSSYCLFGHGIWFDG